MPTFRFFTQFRLFSLVSVAAAVIFASSAGLVEPSHAFAETVSPYGQVARFPSSPGPDSAATFGPATTEVSTLTAGHFVDPVGLAVDTSDPTVPRHDGYAVYALDNVNPQALNARGFSSLESLALQYRIQKLGDRGEVLGSTVFTLQSTASEPGLHAVSLAVDAAIGRVYVLITDSPSEADAGHDATDRIDAWTTGSKGGTPLSPAVKLPEDELPEDPLTHAGEFSGPHALQTGSPELVGDIDGESITVDGSGSTSDLALGGNRYTALNSTTPIIERFTTAAPHAGQLDASHPTWEDASATEDAAAKAWAQGSANLYSLSTDADGSLNVELGPEANAGELHADSEPNMANVSSDLQSTMPVLPWEDASEGAPNTPDINTDDAATVGFAQDGGNLNDGQLAPEGATPQIGTLAPSVVQLSSEGATFPSGLYAGLVADLPEGDPQSPLKDEFTWTRALGSEDEMGQSLAEQATLGIRVFDTTGNSLAMIGNATAGGACNVQGGVSYGTLVSQGYTGGSFVALAPGREGVLFALVQSDLVNTAWTEEEAVPLISPGSPVGETSGDQVIEFAPGAGQAGAEGEECPQPSGSFSVTNQTLKETTPIAGSGAITVPTDTKLEFNAEGVDLDGSPAWAYDWDFTNGTPEGTLLHPWTLHNQFTKVPGSGHAWEWPSPSTEFTYATPGSYTAKLSLVNDFGTLTAQRTINVVNSEPITGTKITAPATATAGESVSFQGSVTLPQFDSVADYHWEFGDGTGENVTSSTVHHAYASPGVYKITLTVQDALGQKETVSQTITVTAKTEPAKKEETSHTTTTATTTPPSNPPPIQIVNTSPTEVDAHIASSASKQGTVAVQISCPVGKPSCSGTITLKTASAIAAAGKSKSKHKATPLMLGAASFTLAGGKSETVLVHLSSRGLALLRKKHTLRAVATIKATDPAGHAKTVTETITLRAAPIKGDSKGKRH
jgi:PKD repeat protein